MLELFYYSSDLLTACRLQIYLLTIGIDKEKIGIRRTSVSVDCNVFHLRASPLDLFSGTYLFLAKCHMG